MGEWEDKLPPIARERLARIGEITTEEKERVKDTRELDSLVSEFYKSQFTAEDLWKRLRGYKDRGKGHLLKEAQWRLMDSLTLGGEPAEFKKRKDGILALETLKKNRNTSNLEQLLNSIQDLRKRYGGEKQRVYDNLKAQVEKNPQLRVQHVKQGESTVIVQVTVDEAVKRSTPWRDFLTLHEKRYAQEYAKLTERLLREMR